jgi:hypothetical protein
MLVRFRRRKSKANSVSGGVVIVTDGNWLYFWVHYASEKYSRYRYFRDARVNAYISANRSPLLMIIMNIIMVSNLHGE